MRISKLFFKDFSPPEVSRNVELLGTDNDNLCSIQQLFGNSGREATHEVTSAIDEQGLKIEHTC